jgi:hypothetical protein
MPVHEMHDELVDVIASHQRFARQRDGGAPDIGARQGAELGPGDPGKLERHERPQHALETGLAGAAAARDERQPAVLAAQNVENPARVLKRPVVQQPGWLVLHSHQRHVLIARRRRRCRNRAT